VRLYVGRTFPEVLAMHTVSIQTAHVKAVALFATTKDVSYWLTGMLLETGPNGAFIVATDGHAFLAASRVSSDPMPDYQIILPADTVAAMAKCKAPAVIVTMPETDGAWVSGTRRKISVQIPDKTGGGLSLSAEEMDGKFPDWRRVAKHEQGFEPAFCDPRLIKRVDDAARIIKCTTSRNAAAHLSPGSNGGCSFAWLDDVGEACAWVMPMRITQSDLPTRPVWSA
jgi:DNA polymerase III sliding clamp (beta) subunit (PCNA family)